MVTELMDPLARLSHDIRDATVTLSPQEARFLVDLYYVLQEDRKRSGNQVRAMAEEPHAILGWVFQNMETLENDIKRALDAYSNSQPVARWARNIVGIGPVIAAGLLAHIDITRAPTAGCIWRLAGLDPTVSWLGADKAHAIMQEIAPPPMKLTPEIVIAAAKASGRKLENFIRLAADRQTREITRKSLTGALARRPWTADLRTLAWKIGQSFVKTHNLPGSFYGPLYVERKQYEIERNDSGALADQAAAALAAKRIGRDTEAYKAYSVGRLPPAHIDARARRWVVKLFLAHWQAVAWEVEYGTPPPKPYILTQPDHTHFIAAPGWPM